MTRDVTGALCDVLRQNALSVAGRPVLYSDDTYRHAWKTELTDPTTDDTCICGLVAAADLRGRLRFSEMTPSYFCEGSAGSEPRPPAVPLDTAGDYGGVSGGLWPGQARRAGLGAGSLPRHPRYRHVSGGEKVNPLVVCTG